MKFQIWPHLELYETCRCILWCFCCLFEGQTTPLRKSSLRASTPWQGPVYFPPHRVQLAGVCSGGSSIVPLHGCTSPQEVIFSYLINLLLLKYYESLVNNLINLLLLKQQ